MPEPAAPATPPPTTPPPDPVVGNIYKTFGFAIDPEFRMKPIPPESLMKDTDRMPATPPAEKPPETKPEDGKPPETKPDPAAVTDPPPEPEPETKPAETPPELVVTRPINEQILEIQKKVNAQLESLAAKIEAPPVAPPAPPATKPPIDPDAAFEATLPEENRETIELLRWAEQNNRPEFKGKADEIRGYYKRLDEFLATNPEEDAITEFREKHKPKVSESALRKINRDMIQAAAVEEAKTQARKELDPEIQALRQKQYELEIKPVLAQANDEFRLRFSSEERKLPAGVDRVDTKLAGEILSTTPEKASTKNKVVAPILHFHANAANEYMLISHGLRDYNQADQTHQFLGQFLFHQEQVLLRAPEASRIRDGKQFLPTIKYRELLAKDPEGTRAKYWEFSHDDVRNMLEINAHRHVQDRMKEIKEAAKEMGLVEQKQDPKPSPDPKQTPANPPNPPSPKAKPSMMPGSASTTPIKTKLQEHLGSLYPEEVLKSGT